MTRAKTDCFAYRPGQQNPRRKAECTALDKLYCKEGECRFYKEQQNVAPYIKSEYSTHKPSAAALIRAQGEQIRETPAEYVARKYGIGGNTVDKGNATELPEQKR